MLMKVKEVKGCVGKGSDNDDDGVRKQVVEKLDNELAKGDERAALFLVKQSLTQPGGLCCFGAARQVPWRLYTLDELKLTVIEATSLLSPVDMTLGSIERNLQIAAVLGGVAAWTAFELSPQQLFYISLGLLFLWTLDLDYFPDASFMVFNFREGDRRSHIDDILSEYDMTVMEGIEDAI